MLSWRFIGFGIGVYGLWILKQELEFLYGGGFFIYRILKI